MKLVSVIVPIYNTENYLSRCIESILNQSYSNIQLILVNDGSTDKSSDICIKYARCDNRVNYIYEENKGVSVARNRGIDIASGSYVVFIDSDDYIAQNYIETLLNAIEKSNTDLAICNYRCFFDNGVEIHSGYSCSNSILNIEKELSKFIYNKSEFVLTAVVRLYSLEIIKKYNIRFYEDMSYGEDYIFQLEYACKCKKACLLSDEIYFRAEDNPYSLSKSDLALLGETHKKINRKLYSILEGNEYLFRAAALNCIERFIQAIYGMIIITNDYKSFYDTSFNFFSQCEIRKALKFINYVLPNYSKVKFLNHISNGCSKYLYYKISVYFKIRFSIKRKYLMIKFFVSKLV